MILTIFYSLVILCLSIYSYFLVDPNITFIQNKIWENFRSIVVYLGYYRRDISWLIYLVLVVILFLFHCLFVKRYKKVSPITIALIIGLILIFSYPFLSHDFFNYMFDAKIFTFYHKNPYLFKALDFPADQWTRFMHWTHRTYPYGPVFLVLSFIPSFLGMGKFTLSFILFKGMFIFFYILAIYLLNKLNKKWAAIFATNPLIIIEGLVSSHNDLIALSLAIIGIYYLFKKNSLAARLFLLLSGGIKYITLPLLLISKSQKKITLTVLLGLIIVLGYLSFRSEIQPWYFLAIFALIPFYEDFINRLNIFFAGLLFSYYPYIRLGGWDTSEKVLLKHKIIFVFFVINVFYLILKRFKIVFFKR